MTARERPLLPVGAASDRSYTEHGYSRAEATRLRRLGVPAEVAAALRDVASHLPWLAETFSRRGLLALAERHLITRDIGYLTACEQMDVSRVRGYVSRTSITVPHIHWLMTCGVPSASALAWHQRTGGGHEESLLPTILTSAVLLHGVPATDVAGWVRYANRHRITYKPAEGGWTFLGGDTALFAAAGITPAEADQMTRTGVVDRRALSVLAGLRSGLGAR